MTATPIAFLLPLLLLAHAQGQAPAPSQPIAPDGAARIADGDFESPDLLLSRGGDPLRWLAITHPGGDASLAIAPDRIRATLDLARPRPEERIHPTPHLPPPPKRPRAIRPITCRDGTLVDPAGNEIALWGVNFQTALAWEYNGRLKRAGVPLDAPSLAAVSERNLTEVAELGCDVVRLHLCPADFSDGQGNLRDGIYLQTLDDLLARCARRGVYVYLTLLNDMHTRTHPDSFLVGRERDEWLFDPAIVQASERFIRQLLDRPNPLTGLRPADDPGIVMIEIMNEPDYPAWPQLLIDTRLARIRALFDAWRARHAPDDPPALAFVAWRAATLRDVIARYHAAIRGCGARQPIGWNLNWPRMIREHEDVFTTVAESPVDAISFCLYPGQDLVPHPFWAHPVNLDGRNHLPYLRDQIRDYDRLGWVLGKRFARKAKAVYEYETFYTQNAHLYPAMARLFRALGVQIAQMWTYSLTPSAERLGGAHHLNLYCTPNKAASFVVADAVFRRSPRLCRFELDSETTARFDGCALSQTDDVALFHDADLLAHSRAIPALPVPIGQPPRRIVGCGSSPLVQFDGSGLYSLDIENDRIDLTIRPDARFVLPHWKRPPTTDGDLQAKTCALDPSARHRFVLLLPGWDRGVTVTRCEPDGERPVANRGGTPDFIVTAGRYRISRVPHANPQHSP